MCKAFTVLSEHFNKDYEVSEIDDNGEFTITYSIKNTVGKGRRDYSTYYLAQAIKSDRSHTLSNEEYTRFRQWYSDALDKYNIEDTKYKNNTEAQFNNIYNMLCDANPQIRQTATPIQKVWTNDPETRGRTTSFDVKVYDYMKYMYIQSGANSGEHHKTKWKDLSLSSIGMSGARTLTRESASATIAKVQKAVKMVSAERSGFGANQVSLERAYDNNANYSENLQGTESNIRDTDMSKELVELAKHSILEQAGQAMIAQANQQNQGLLQLLQR